MDLRPWGSSGFWDQKVAGQGHTAHSLIHVEYLAVIADTEQNKDIDCQQGASDDPSRHQACVVVTGSQVTKRRLRMPNRRTWRHRRKQPLSAVHIDSEVSRQTSFEIGVL